MKQSFVYFYIITALTVSSLKAQSEFSVSGTVYHVNYNEPLTGVNLIIEELKVGTVSDEHGRFEFRSIKQGIYNLKFSYVGHKTVTIQITVPSAESENLKIILVEETLKLGEVMITGNPLEIDPKEISQPSLILSNLELQIKRNSTIAQTLDFQPGIAMQSNGIAPGKPVIRGLGSNRILILEDGLRMGDLSNTAIDHAISEDGNSPEKIEVLRGPASLLYGSNAIGGVVNVLTETIPDLVPQGIIGEGSLGFGSVNDEKSGRLHLGYGVDNISLHGDYLKKKTNSYKTPSGSRVENSNYDSEGLKLGAAFHPVDGVIGLSFNDYKTEYGIPFNPAESIEGPIAIDMMKREYRMLTEMENIKSFISSFSLKGGYQDYQHNEIELEEGIVGSSFSLRSISTDLSFKQRKFNLLENLNGIFGFWLLQQNYEVEGEEAFTPNADYTSIAGYLYEQISFGNSSLNFGVRYENNSVNIPESVLSDSLFVAVERNFNSISGSIGIIFNITTEIALFSNIANAFRAPTVEELSSFAIHAATASFDIGDRNLDKEHNFGFDAGLRISSSRFNIEGSFYYNRIFDYIYREPSDLFYDENGNSSFNDSTGIPVFFYTQSDAVIYGLELSTIYEIISGITIRFMCDYVRAKNSDSKEYLPLTPPLRFAFEPRYTGENYWLGFTWKIAAEQNNISEFETPTSGYGIIDFYSGLKFLTGNFIHSLDLKVNNLLNQEYHDHLSAIKDFAVMPGRNILISYRFLF